MVKTSSARLPTLMVFLWVLSGCSRNDVANYLDGVELQYEEPQRRELLSALNDAISLPESELKKQRYRDARGNHGALDLRTLLSRHLVPDTSGKTLGEHFFRDLKSPRAQAKIKALIADLER